MTVFELLRAKYPVGQYALLGEVRDSAGFRANRSADAIAVGLWPSRGCEVEGFEIKTARSDWLRELKEPKKAEAFVKYCDRWWLAIGDLAVAKLEEIPPTWGLMVATNKRLKIVKPAPALTPQPMDRFFLAAMLKRATDTALSSPEVRAEIERRDKDLRERLAHHQSIDLKRATQQVEHLERSIREFEEASGVKINTYAAGRIGDAVREILTGAHAHRCHQLVGIKRQAAELHAWLQANVPDIPEQQTA